MKPNIKKIREFIEQDKTRHGTYAQLGRDTGVSDSTINGWAKENRQAPAAKQFIKYVTNIDRAPEEKEEYLKAAGIPKEYFADWMYQTVIYGRPEKEPVRILQREEPAEKGEPAESRGLLDIEGDKTLTDKDAVLILTDIHDSIMAECEEISRTLDVCLGLAFAIAKEEDAVSRDAMRSALARILHIIGDADRAIIGLGNDLYRTLEKMV